MRGRGALSSSLCQLMVNRELENSLICLITSKGTVRAVGNPLSAVQIQTIYDWIAAGALDN